jgi:chorismate mutase/prephenate dehydratase
VDEGRREVEELRQELARIDEQLVAALHRRARTSKSLGRLRGDQALALPMSDQATSRPSPSTIRGDMPEDALRDIFREVHAACLALELPATVVFAGPEGGAGHAAVRGRFGRGPSMSAEGTVAALEAVTRKRAQLAVVPFETSTEGPVQGTLLALLASDLRIAEVLDTKHHLHVMSPEGDAQSIARIYVTPADHARCQRFLANLSPSPLVIDVVTPVAACERAAAETGSAAIASEVFGEDFALKIAHRSVLDVGESRVRYAVVAPRPSGKTGNDVTSLVFGAQDGPGALLDVLRIFAERGVNLTNIQSHPAGEGPRPAKSAVDSDAWRYLFYVEMAGHFTDRPLVAAFEEMKRMTRFFKVLGSYPSP